MQPPAKLQLAKRPVPPSPLAPPEEEPELDPEPEEDPDDDPELEPDEDPGWAPEDDPDEEPPDEDPEEEPEDDPEPLDPFPMPFPGIPVVVSPHAPSVERAKARTAEEMLRRTKGRTSALQRREQNACRRKRGAARASDALGRTDFPPICRDSTVHPGSARSTAETHTRHAVRHGRFAAVRGNVSARVIAQASSSHSL
jgi:hypothetical protein